MSEAIREVRINNCSLQEDDLTPDRIVIRGVLDQASLENIRLDWYQREQGFSDKHTDQIMSAFFLGTNVADITIGMRGQRVKSNKDTYILLDKCYCIDGGQRLHAAIMAVDERPDLKIHLGVKAYTDTTEKFENELFCRLGTTQVKISASILIRNKKKESPAASMLINISKNPDFALKDRICWDQIRARHQLMMGFTFTGIAAALHAHKGGARAGGRRPYDLLASLDRVLSVITEPIASNNLIAFFDAVDRCWTVRHLEGGSDEPRPHLKGAFLCLLARLLSSYEEFWTGDGKNQFQFPEKFVRRLKGLKLTDYVRANKYPKELLYEVLRKRLQLQPIFEKREEAAE